jgi:hypothetical protein
MRQVIFALLGICLFSSPAAAFYTINGDVSDWGINLSAASSKNYLDNNLPSGGNDIDAYTEDNVDATTGFAYVGPGYSQGNLYDAEAMYFDNDNTYAYIAVITGTPQTGSQFRTGDLFFDTLLPSDNHYRYGINTQSGQLYSVTGWQNVVYSQHAISNPWRIENGATLGNPGDTQFAYSTTAVNDHYVMEAKIPLFLLGLTSETTIPNKKLYVHWTMECGNDYLNLEGDISHHAPEPASLALLASGLVGLFGFRRKS